MRPLTWLLLATIPLAAACGGDKGTGPADDAEQMQRRLSAVSDSLDRSGDEDGAEQMRGLAELVRLSGSVSQVDVSVDGVSQRFNAVAVQSGFAPPSCAPDCYSYALPTTQVLVTWRGESAEQLLLLVTDRVGTSEFVPLPDSSDLFDFDDTQSGDSLSDDGGDVDGFTFTFGTYAERGSRQLWYTASGTFVTGEPSVSGASCPAMREAPRGVDYECRRASFRFAADATLETLPAFAGGDGQTAGASRRLTLASQPVAGVAITVTGFDDEDFSRSGLRALLARRRSR
jgi:hypothetical protein